MKNIFVYHGWTEMSRILERDPMVRVNYPEPKDSSTTEAVIQVGKKKEFKDDVRVRVTISIETISKEVKKP